MGDRIIGDRPIGSIGGDGILSKLSKLLING